MILFFLSLGIELCVPYYNFRESKPFHGNKIYNPYESKYPIKWLKANFHAHSDKWKALTPACSSTPEEIIAAYKNFGYDIAEISDYQHINNYNNKSETYIPCYEHGFNKRKTHQLCLNAENVLWFDYPFYQTINHKQCIINLLKSENNLVVLAHPDLKSAYSFNDIKYLCNYDLIEVLNRASESTELWDAVLSAGKAKFLLADDDVHDVKDISLIGRCCTFVGSEDTKKENILNALKTGCAIGVDMKDKPNENLTSRLKKHKEIILPKSIKIIKDSLILEMNDSVQSIAFIGQNGRGHITDFNGKIAKCSINTNDTYIRTVIYEKDDIRVFLNPVYRYEDSPVIKEDCTIGIFKTILLWTLSAIVYFTLLFFAIKLLSQLKIMFFK